MLKVDWKEDVRHAICGLKLGLTEAAARKSPEWTGCCGESVCLSATACIHTYKHGTIRKFDLCFLADGIHGAESPALLSRGQSCTASHPERAPGSVMQYHAISCPGDIYGLGAAPGRIEKSAHDWPVS